MNIFKKDQSRFPVEMINGGIATDSNATLAMVLHDLSDREKSNEARTPVLLLESLAPI